MKRDFFIITRLVTTIMSTAQQCGILERLALILQFMVCKNIINRGNPLLVPLENISNVFPWSRDAKVYKEFVMI